MIVLSGAAAAVLALPSFASAQAVQSPDASTGAISSVEQTTATFSGSVNPHGVPTTYDFEYGTSTAYGAKTAQASAGAGTSSTSVSQQVGALKAGTTYHVRIVATSAGGTTRGVDRSFTTDKAPVVKAKAPTVSTGGSKNVGQTTATITGSVNGQGNGLSYFFEFGPSTKYGATTTVTSSGSGSSGVAFNLTGLIPATKYHYRVVASGPGGTTRGADRTFDTSRVPNALTIGTAPTVIKFSGTLTAAGTLTGTGSAGVRIQLQARPFPFSAGFANVAAVVTTDAGGRWAINYAPLLTSQLRAVALTSPNTVSPAVQASVRALATIHVSTSHPKKGHRIKVYGSVQPGLPGARVSIQRKSDSGRYVTIKRLQAEPANDIRSTYSTKITINGKRRLRAVVTPATGAYAQGRSVVRDISPK